MKNKTPKTIADLDINWTFGPKFHTGMVDNRKLKIELFHKLNPKLSNMTMKYCTNVFHVLGTNDVMATACHNESLASYISFLTFLFQCQFSEMLPFKLEKFERISDMEYIIHGK